MIRGVPLLSLPLVLWALTAQHAVGTRPANRPNIVLVMSDDQGWGDVGYNGHPELETPHLDAAAAAGLRFDRFYAAAPVCSPTRGSIMTGRHPNRFGCFQWGYPLRPQEITLAEALQTVGYQTGHFGKWHLGSVRRRSPVSPGASGFDVWFSAPNFFDNDPVMSDMGKAVATRGESSMVTVDRALAFIRRCVEEKRPFLAVVWFGSPHGPHRAMPEDAQLYNGQPEPKRQFYGEITALDRAFGKLRGALQSLGIRENTILWYSSDNGALPQIGSTGGHRGHKGNVYDGGLLVPAFLEWPARIPEPRVTGVRCNTCDIYPTLLEITGVSLSHQPQLDGISLVPLIDGKMDARPQPMGFWNYPIAGIGTPSAQWMDELLKAQQAGRDLDPHVSSQRAAQLPDPPYPLDHFPGHAAWIDGHWKLHRISGKNGKPHFELYDLSTDPAETTNVFQREPQHSEAMVSALEQWQRSVVQSLNGEDYPSQ